MKRGIGPGKVLKMAAWALATMLVIFCTGCSQVVTQKPLHPEFVYEDPDQLKGSWLVEEDGEYTGTVGISINNSGDAFVGFLEVKDDQIVLSRYQLFMTPGPGHRYVSFKQLNGDSDEYFFARVEFSEGGSIRIFGSDHDAFADAVEQGDLEGTVQRDKKNVSVILTSSPHTILEFMKDKERSDLFEEYSEGLVLRKLPMPVD